MKYGNLADRRQVFGLAGNPNFLLAVASQLGFCEPVLFYGVRSC
jgi:hypothetical protein